MYVSQQDQFINSTVMGGSEFVIDWSRLFLEDKAFVE